MDQDVKEQFDRIGALLERSIEGAEQSARRQDSLELLVMDVKESLEREMTEVRKEMKQGFHDINVRFDTQAARLDRHAGLWQAGSRWSSRMDAWAEKVDSALDVKSQEIADLRQRLSKLEKNGK